jgi:predicted AAA+ superfamily ATPase
MFPRSLEPPRSAFFLFGPRGTGKSTWARERLPDAHVIDLLPPEAMLRFDKAPSLFRAEVLAQPKNRWIVVDEVQRVPRLLDEVHVLMEQHGYKKFALTGSSARKLKRGAANLLAGRAIMRNLYPLTSAELGDAAVLQRMLTFGSLPLCVQAEDDVAREDFLRAYVTVYLNEEIRAEALVRDLGSFARFLEIATLAAGQTTNVSSIARDAAISRETARGYFEVLVDTLIGSFLPAYRPRAKVKEVAQPKFYWFDTGVLRAAAGGFDQPLPSDMEGVMLEHLVFRELQSYLHYSGTKGSLAYWATPSGSEVDFVFWRGDRVVAIEVKHARSYRSEFRKGIAALLGQMKAKSYVVYRGDQELEVEGTRVLPLGEFLRRLHAGSILQ